MLGEMAKLLPYYRWYPADAESDSKYAAMTLCELGLFHRCLNHSWLNSGLSADLSEMSRELRIPEKELRSLWPRVAKCFVQSPSDERLRNLRLEEERSYAEGKSRQASDAVRSRESRKSGVERAIIGRSSDVSSDVHPRAYGSVSESVFESSEEKRKGAIVEVLAQRLNTDFEVRFIAAFTRHRKHRGTETQILVSQMLLDVDWDKFDATHVPFCGYWDRHDWTKCPVTMLEWFRNGMPGPPPESKNGKRDWKDDL